MRLLGWNHDWHYKQDTRRYHERFGLGNKREFSRETDIYTKKKDGRHPMMSIHEETIMLLSSSQSSPLATGNLLARQQIGGACTSYDSCKTPCSTLAIREFNGARSVNGGVDADKRTIYCVYATAA
ncbi:hypothetical protein AC579_10517 [Pseudocercospora musae]|uniref:Uncharacterized protein n=1 Tax=Pseudocercospora musae TaxID=113226 RepID=A0A139I5L9_9PEZI|nr:hypothetical protein AC579_10517 [Pseudocercospora musae]